MTLPMLSGTGLSLASLVVRRGLVAGPVGRGRGLGAVVVRCLGGLVGRRGGLGVRWGLGRVREK